MTTTHLFTGVSLELCGMIDAGRYDRVSAKLAETDFQADWKRFTIKGAKIFRFGTPLNTLEAEMLMREEGHQLGFLETLLAYGRERPDEQRYHPIVCRPYAGLTPYLSAGELGRTFYIGRETRWGAFRPHCGFLGIPLT